MVGTPCAIKVVVPRGRPLEGLIGQEEFSMTIVTALTRDLGLANPIIKAPLAGSGDTPELVAAVSNAGAIGFLGAVYMRPEEISAAAAAVRSRTARPFGINLFAPVQPSEQAMNPETMLARVAPYFAELGLPAPSLPKSTTYSFDEQLAAVLECGPTCFSFTFGALQPRAVEAVKARRVFLIGTATTVAEAVELEKSGVDAIVAQGSEAGGHRGTFSGDFSAGMVGTMALVPQVVDAVRVPVIASGGIMDGRGIVAAMALGASAVQMGTAFLVCEEAGTSEAYKQAILSAKEDQTRITRAFSGRPARGIVNRFMQEVEFQHLDDAILPFPTQNALTRPLRTAAAKQGRAEFLSLWAGQGVRLARRQSASELVARLVKEIGETLAALPRQNAASP
jgi:nitronate monooxygenase